MSNSIPPSTFEGLSDEVPSSLLDPLSLSPSQARDFPTSSDQGVPSSNGVKFKGGVTPRFFVLDNLARHSSGIVTGYSSTKLLDSSSLSSSINFKVDISSAWFLVGFSPFSLFPSLLYFLVLWYLWRVDASSQKIINQNTILYVIVSYNRSGNESLQEGTTY